MSAAYTKKGFSILSRKILNLSVLSDCVLTVLNRVTVSNDFQEFTFLVSVKVKYLHKLHFTTQTHGVLCN